MGWLLVVAARVEGVAGDIAPATAVDVMKSVADPPEYWVAASR
jgi:hypothetical protein